VCAYISALYSFFFFFSSRRRHTRSKRDWSSDVCSSDLEYNNMTVRDFLVEIIAQHNRQVEPHKRFEVGNVTVTTTTDNIYRFLRSEERRVGKECRFWFL